MKNLVERYTPDYGPTIICEECQQPLKYKRVRLFFKRWSCGCGIHWDKSTISKLFIKYEINVT